MGKRILAVLASLALAFGIVVGSAGTANAATWYGCPEAGWVCFYNYQSYNYVNDGHGGIYGFNLRNGWGQCHVLPTSGTAGWTNGKVYNAASSLFINNSGVNNLPGWSNITFYDSNACSGSDYSFTLAFESGDTQGISILANYYADGGYWNDRIGSFKVLTGA